MHLLPLLLFPSSFALARYPPRASNIVQATPTDIASGETQKQLAAQAFQNAWKALPDVGTCSKQTVHIRRELYDSHDKAHWISKLTVLAGPCLFHSEKLIPMLYNVSSKRLPC